MYAWGHVIRRTRAQVYICLFCCMRHHARQLRMGSDANFLAQKGDPSFLGQAWQIHHAPHSHAESDNVDQLLQQAIGFRRPRNASAYDYLVQLPFNPSAPLGRRMQPGILQNHHAALNRSIARLLHTPSWDRAVVDAGDDATLCYQLGRCSAGSPFTVVALGCSMTEGRMACFGKGTGACMDNGCPQLRWCGKVERWLSLLLPCKVRVVCSRRGWGSNTYAYGFEGLIARHRPALVLSNIAHCDTTLTPVTEIYGEVKAAAEYVIRRTLVRAAAPRRAQGCVLDARPLGAGAAGGVRPHAARSAARLSQRCRSLRR